MKKEVRKLFVACKDSYVSEELAINKGDIVLMYPIEFFDKPEPTFRAYVKHECGYDPSESLNLMILSPKEYQQMLNTTTGEFDIKCSRIVDVYELPHLFNELKIAPRNVTVEVDN